MSITVYWSCLENEWMRSKEPQSIYKNFAKDIINKQNNIVSCPATKEYLRNIFGIQSLYDYNFQILKDGAVSSELYDQKFFDNHVLIRSREDKLFSFHQRFVFFTEEKSLLFSGGILPFLENNNITKKCITLPGTFDIGRWFRVLDFAFYLKKEYDSFDINKDEIFQYMQFHTSKKIIFKQFLPTDNIRKYLDYAIDSKSSKKSFIKSLDEYYLMLRHKKHIIKEIKRNLI
jgi:hypothetical protein